MAECVTNRGVKVLLQKALDGNDALDLRMCVILGTQTGVVDRAHNTVADIDAVTSVSIHSERVALTGETVTEDDGNNRAAFDVANVSFAAAPGVTAQGVATYDEGTGADSGREVITIHTTGFPQPMDGGLNVNVADLFRGNALTA